MEGADSKRHWAAHTKKLREELALAIPGEKLRSLHALRPWKHALVAVALLFQLGLLSWGLFSLGRPLLWLPLALLQGLMLFNFTVLLHEVVHKAVFKDRTSRFYPALAWAYALPSGISPTQFTRWHLDHHAGLGSAEGDPKRHHLSPKRNARWLKLLYFTPALIPIYFNAAAREGASYSPELRRRIRTERLLSVFFHALLAGSLWIAFGGFAALRLYFVPYLFGFPIAFALNRLGQHYDVEPSDAARWGTRMRTSWFWDWAFLWSSYHLEHHYFPGVPLYNLRKLSSALQPLFEVHGMPTRSYPWLLWNWLVLNRAPHTRWGN